MAFESLSPDAVRTRLDEVTDPELDRSIVELGYVDEVALEDTTDGARVMVQFTLPTAWCSPAFAWMMATDVRDEVAALPGVAGVEVSLREHVHEEEINRGVEEERTFEDVFPDADGGVEAVRATLDEKARLARQYAAVEALLDAGVRPEQVVAVRRADVELPPAESNRPAVVFLAGRAFAVSVSTDPLRRYLAKAEETGLLDDGDERLFRTPEGDPISAAEFELVHRRTRLARVNMDGQGSVCDALNDARRRTLDRGEAD